MLPAVFAAWLGLAAFAQVCVALFGVLSRALQTQAEPPVPALRLLLIFNLLGLAVLVLLDVAGLGAAALKRLWLQRQQGQQEEEQGKQQWKQQGKQQGQGQGQGQGQRSHDAVACNGAEAQIGSAGRLAEGHTADGSSAELGGSGAASGSQGDEGQHAQQHEGQHAQQHEGQHAQQHEGGRHAPPEAAVPEWRLARPEVPLQRGLSRKLAGWEARHPLAHRWMAATVTAVSVAVACGCQLVAPGFVDAAIVQLVNTFGVLVVVFIQAALLGHRLPLLVWPCSAGTVAGAAMVIVPSIGQSTSGGLDSARAWLGFGLSVLFMLSASIMYILLQAFRRLRFKHATLLYYYMALTVVVALPLTLALDGTDWASGFAGWTAGDWCMLMLGGSLLYVGSMALLQVSAWQLGAPLVSMLYGLRLVASILLSMAILSTTVIQTGVQIAGAVLTVLSVTTYAAHRWLVSRQAARATTGSGSGGGSSGSGSFVSSRQADPRPRGA